MTAYTVFVELDAASDWLALSPDEREAIVAEEVGPVIEAHPDVSVSFFDVEAFTAECTDVAVFETDSLEAHAGFVDDLKDTALFAEPYYRIVRILPGVRADYV